MPVQSSLQHVGPCEKTTRGGENTFGKQVFVPHFFWGLLQSSLLVLFALLPSTFFTFCKGFTLQSGLLGNGDPT